MAVNGENICQINRPPNVESLSQELKGLMLARSNKIREKSENKVEEMSNKGDNIEFAVCKSSVSKISYEKSGPQPIEEQKLSPHISHHPTIWIPPFRFVRPPSVYSWIRGQSHNHTSPSNLSKTLETTPCMANKNQNDYPKVSLAPFGSDSTSRSIISSVIQSPYISNPSAKQMGTTTAKEFAILDSHLCDPSRSSKNWQSQSQDISSNSPTLSTSPKAALDNLYALTDDDKDLSSMPHICSCQRSLQLILCKSCGNVLTGRIRKKCLVHPNQIFLMDMVCCAECESRNLKEISNARKLDRK